MMPASLSVGWDVGGAHLKAALFDGARVIDIAQWACPLWQGIEQLDIALDAARLRWPGIAQADHAVTMTGEMCDLFENREAGVMGLAVHMVNALRGDAMQFDAAPSRMAFYGGRAGWFGLPSVAPHWHAIASANWRATAHCVAEQCGDALLVDVGSTTTDLIVVRDGEVASQGQDDAGRLEAGELVYCGVVRTPLCALAQRMPLAGRTFNVMNEWFATTADVYRLTGELNPDHDQYPAADGGSKGFAGTCQRMAHMVGHDARDADDAAWRAFAHAWRDAQLRLIRSNLDCVIAHSGLPAQAPIVGAGCGHFLAQALARQLGRPYLGFEACVPLAPGLDEWARLCAPSVAVAVLGAYAGLGAHRTPYDDLLGVVPNVRSACGS